MLRSFMFMQWKVSRWILAIALPLCIGLPILVLRFAEKVGTNRFGQSGVDMLRGMEIWLPVFPVMAALIGAAYALAAWTWDHNTRHVYALSLPVERWRYALLKMVAGSAHLLIAIGALFLGALIATAMTKLPTGLHSYPVAFSFRFLLAAFIVYAVVFALASGTIATAVRLITAFVLIFIVGSVLVGWVNSTFHLEFPSPLSILVDALVNWPGPFSVFGGSWMLIDV